MQRLKKSTSNIRYEEMNYDLLNSSRKEDFRLTDPVGWIEYNMGVSLFSNQIDIVETLNTGRNFNILGTRGSGKTQGLAYGVSELGAKKAGTQFISSAPVEKQAKRLIKYVKACMKAPNARRYIDWEATTMTHVEWKNGSTMEAVSGQERASSEGEHGNILILDEAHLLPSHSVSSKLSPMIGSLGKAQTIRLGVSIGRNHFYRAVMAPKALNCLCPWQKSEIFLMEDDPIFFKGKQFSRNLLEKMPVPYKLKYFPNRPDLQEISGEEISILDWQTQYELEWVDDIHNLLSDEDQDRLTSGGHGVLTTGVPSERYFGGLDTAPGSLVGRGNTDSTILSIWRLRKDGSVERVASFQWVGNILAQEQEIWEICNPRNGMFRCELVFADYSNIATGIVEKFKVAGMPILGVLFGSSARKAGSAKNWKNVLYDNFLVKLQNKQILYPEINRLKQEAISAKPDVKIQIENMLEGFWQWCCIQRIRGKSINDKIQAPTDSVEDDEGGEKSQVAHDDHTDADVLAVYAATHPRQLMKEMAKGDIFGYEIPTVVIGQAYSGGMAPTAHGQAGISNPTNPLAQPSSTSGVWKGQTGTLPSSAETQISGFIKMNQSKGKS